MSRWLRWRNALDRLVALLLLLVLSPLIVALALAVKLSDHGPSFVGVDRVGRRGRTFTMWKLRSMRAETADGRARGISLTSSHDDRITPVGVKLRAYYLDELPQLWNVVRGDMALLGARPEAPEYVDMTDDGWRSVLDARPGMAGPTQLMVNDWERTVISASPDGSRYQSEVVPVKLAIDTWYLESAGPRLDLLVAVTLVRRFLPGTGSYTLKRLIRTQVPASLATISVRPAPATDDEVAEARTMPGPEAFPVGVVEVDPVPVIPLPLGFASAGALKPTVQAPVVAD